MLSSLTGTRGRRKNDVARCSSKSVLTFICLNSFVAKFWETRMLSLLLFEYFLEAKKMGQNMVKTRENRQILPRGPLNLTLMAIFVISRHFRSRKVVLEKYHIPYISELALICCGHASPLDTLNSGFILCRQLSSCL